MSESTLYVGPAGWSYPDWNGIVYPANADRGFKPLTFISRLFRTVEINVTFYRPVNKYMSSAWVRNTADNPGFLFTAKLWQRFTHQREPYTSKEPGLVREGLDPLAEAGKLGAVLCQFPWSFKNDVKNQEWLSKLIDTFHDYPLVMEVRHKSWDTPEVLDLFNEKGVGFAAIDQPVIGQSIEPKAIRTGSVGYIRLHGRNYKTWFPPKDSKDEETKSSRYDYLYSDSEIKEWAEKIKSIHQGASNTFVIQNNHPWGQAVANSMQLMAALGETDIRAPESLMERFPQLRTIASSIGFD